MVFGVWIGRPGRASAADTLMTESTAARLGLTEAWRRQLPVPAGAQSIVDQQLFVDPGTPQKYVEVIRSDSGNADGGETGEGNGAEGTGNGDDVEGAEGNSSEAAGEAEVLFRIRTDRVDQFGRPIGEEEARRLARNEVRKLARRGVTAEVTVREVASVRLYTVADDGTLECRNAETGETIWLTRAGNFRLGYHQLGVSRQHLSLINGGNLLVIDAATGELSRRVPTIGSPIFGSVNVGGYAVVPTGDGVIQGYRLEEPGAFPVRKRVAGTALAVPTKAVDSSRLVWGTEDGFVYAMEMRGEPSVAFRLNVDGIVGARAAAASGSRFFFGSDTGQVYSLTAERTGTVNWSRALGEPLYDPPTVVDDQVLLRTTYGNLFSLGIDDGLPTWERPVATIDQLLAVFGKRIYASSLTGHLVALNRETGERIAAVHRIHPNNYLINRSTNRLYLLADSGLIQCLRPIDQPMPSFNKVVEAAAESGAEEKGRPDAEPTRQQSEPQRDPTDPFGGANDPFEADGEDPFAPAAGGDDASDNADPFGAGGGDQEDPFGGF